VLRKSSKIGNRS